MIELVKYRSVDGVRNALVKDGRKWMKVLYIDATKTGGMTMRKVPQSDRRFMTPLLRKGKPYPMSRALTVFRRFAKSHGATKTAKRFITEAGNG